MSGGPPNTSLQAQFQTAMALHKQGRLADAARLYEAVLASDKSHFAAMHCLGAIAYHTGNLEKAVTLIADAVRLNPKIAQADVYRSAALNQLGRHEEALAVCDQTLRINPGFAEAHYNRGNALYGLGRHKDALASYGKAAEIKPDFAEAWANHANALQNLERPDEALASSDKAIALKPNYAQAHYNRGNALFALGRMDQALASYDKAIALKPDYAQAHYNRGNVLNSLKRTGDALAAYDKAIALKPDYAQAYTNRGNLLSDIGRYDEALASQDKAVALKPDYAEAWSNRGTALQYLGRLDEALADHNKALALDPNFAEAYCNRGSVLNSIKRPEEALASFDRAIALKPEFARAHFNKSITELGLGDLPSGWREFEWRRKIVEMSGDRKFPQPMLTSADDLQGKAVLIHYEHGFGDTLQFFRYLALLHKAGARILFNVQDGLKGLLLSSGIPMQFVELDDKSLVYDFHVPLMSLPLVFETTLETIPADIPYLAAEDDLVRTWRGKLGDGGFKIGICWMGNLAHILGVNGRFFSVACFEPLAKLPHVRLISLQKGEGEKQLASLPAGMTVETPAFDSFADTAAIMKNLDLVITTDTVVAHVAGALGVPTWVALQHVSDWRWMFDRPDSPWYPTMRLFRQKSDGDWNGVFEEITAALALQLANAGETNAHRPA